jgi:hypothetical protein
MSYADLEYPFRRGSHNDENKVTASISADKAVARVNAFDWQQIGKNLDEQGSALLQGILSSNECRTLAALYPEESVFRSRVVMGRHGFGRGEYKYFNYPLPSLIQGLREALYAQLSPVAEPLECRDGNRDSLSGQP